MERLIVSAMIAAAVVATAATSAFGAPSAPAGMRVYQNLWVWHDQGHCLRDYSGVTLQTSHNTLAQATPHSDAPGLGGTCEIADWPWKVGIGWLEADTEFFTDEQATMCMSLPMLYNSQAATTLKQLHTWKLNNILNCLPYGYGWAGIWAWSGVYFSNAWHGDWVWSGWDSCCYSPRTRLVSDVRPRPTWTPPKPAPPAQPITPPGA